MFLSFAKVTDAGEVQHNTNNVEGDAPPLVPRKENKMAKKVVGKIKLQIQAGKANPSPPVGPALGQHGVNIMDFCKQFNAKTESQAGYIIPVIIDVYEDRSFTFVIKSPPAPVLIKKALNIPKGSAVPNKTKVGEITRAQLEEIAKIKMNDLNATSMDAAVNMIKGSCRAMGVTVKEEA